MVEIRLEKEIDGKKLANLIEKAERKALGPRGYKITTEPHYEYHYPSSSTKLTEIEVERSIEAKKEMSGGTKSHWGSIRIYATDQETLYALDLEYGRDPAIDLCNKYDSFHVHVAEHHVTRYTSNYHLIEPDQKGYRKYKSDVDALIKEFNRLIK